VQRERHTRWERDDLKLLEFAPTTPHLQTLETTHPQTCSTL